MSRMKISLTPELALSLEAGLKDAIKGVLGNENLRDLVDPDQELRGVHVEMTLDIDQVLIGHDTDRAPTCSIPLLPTVALLIKRMGFQREEAIRVLREIMEEALTVEGTEASKRLLEEKGVNEAMELVKADLIGRLPRTKAAKAIKARGAVLTITGVSQAP